jgi:hypothetical protein
MNLRQVCLLLSGFFAASESAQAAPLNTWGEHIGKGVFALTPYVYAGSSFGVQPWVFGEYGFTDRFELAGALVGTVAPGQTFDAVEMMPRLFVTESTALTVRTTWSPLDSTVTAAPELQGVYKFGSLALTVNASWAPVATVDGFTPGTLGAIVAPEWFFTEDFSAFVELSPLVDMTAGPGNLGDRFYFEVLPGISFTVAEIHSFSMGVAFPVTGFSLENMYGGMWYSISWGGEEEPAEPAAADAGTAPAASPSAS